MSPRDRLAAVLSAEVLDALEALVDERLATGLAQVETRPPRPWLSIEETAEQLGCSREAVRMRIARGRLVTRHHGRRVYVSAESVAELA